MSLHPIAIAQLAMLLLFAILFVQSGLDKVIDRKGNLEWMEPHFASSPFKRGVGPLLSLLTLFEIASGLLCAVAAVAVGYMMFKPSVEATGIVKLIGQGGQAYAFTQVRELVVCAAALVLVTLLQLFLGQRLAKDYAGAASLAPYFIVGIALLFSVHFSVPAEFANRILNPN